MSDFPKVLCNSGPLMALGKLNRLDLLADLYEQVGITSGVYEEVVIQGMNHSAPDALAVRLFWQQLKWPIIEVQPEDLSLYSPPVILDQGELEILALAHTIPDVLVLLDDEIARTEARRLNLNLRGTLGVLVQAFRSNFLTFPQLEILFQQIGARSDIWISSKLCQQILETLRPGE